jgi:exonuclease SbcC
VTTVDLPDGVILIEGDIGSGKSTLLYALEFALFGFSDMKGAHLLSEGKAEGGVVVVFESAGKEYTIERRLRTRKDDVVQDVCSISTGGGKTRLSPSDLKERVVSVLGFNEPTHPKAESLVYRYAVFTPQEQMKEILTRNTEDRLHVIRRVLGAQSYQAAAENSGIVEKKLSKTSYGLKRACEDLEEKRRAQRERSEKSKKIERALPGLESDIVNATGVVADLETRRKDLLSQRESLSKVAGGVEPLRDGIASLEERVKEDELTRTQLERELEEEIAPVIDRYDHATKPDDSAAKLQTERNEAEGRLVTLLSSKETLEHEASKTRDLLSRGFCPTCGQLLPSDFASKSEHVDEELHKLGKDIGSLAKLIKETDEEIIRARAFEELEKDYSRSNRRKAKVIAEVESLSKRIHLESERLRTQRAKFEEARAHIEELEDVEEKINRLGSELDKARITRDEARDRLTRAKAERDGAVTEAELISHEVAKKEKEAAEAIRLSRYEDWLASYFRPTVEQIERETLRQAAVSFTNHFQRFFSSLVEDPDMVVRVKEDFSPVFEREGFEQDFEALSGGERTSMALAYRFALSAVVRDDMASQPELIALDEPTDGFSKEQIYRMRDLLKALGSKQVILVSHEKELESMADHVFLVSKKGGTSRISGPNP